MSDLSEKISKSKTHLLNPKSNDHQLIILGNGFDLECGLNSKFSDFMKDRLKNLIPKDYLHETWITFLTKSDITV